MMTAPKGFDSARGLLKPGLILCYSLRHARPFQTVKMDFTSTPFAFFLVAVLALYYVLNHKWQNRMLLAASYLFYGWLD
jgi:hypothetical protein